MTPPPLLKHAGEGVKALMSVSRAFIRNGYSKVKGF